MSYSEVVETVDLEPIAVSSDPHEDYNFRVEILKRQGRSGHFHVRISRHEFFRLKRVEFSEDGRKRHTWKDERVWVEDVSLDWRGIEGRTKSQVFSKVMREVEAVFGGGSRLPPGGVESYRRVKVMDLDPLVDEEKNKYYRVRIEVQKKRGPKPAYRARVLLIDRVSLQPSFPTVNNKPVYDPAHARVLLSHSVRRLENIEEKTVAGLLSVVRAELRQAGAVSGKRGGGRRGITRV